MQNADYLHHVFRLTEAIYGFKQVPRAWYQELCTFLDSLRFVKSCANSSLLFYSQGNAILYFPIYVDNLIIICNDPSLVSPIIWQLNSKLFTKDHRVLYFFCRVKGLATPTGFLLSQQKYVINLLSNHNLLDSKLVSTSLTVGTSLTTHDGNVLVNATMYHQVVGGL